MVPVDIQQRVSNGQTPNHEHRFNREHRANLAPPGRGGVTLRR